LKKSLAAGSCGMLAPIISVMKTFTILVFLLCVELTFSQKIQGLYCENYDFIKFNQDTATFKLDTGGGLIMYMVGQGRFEVIQNFLLIYASDYHGEKSSYTTIKSQNDSIRFNIKDNLGKGIIYANIAFLDTKGKVIGGTTCNKNGLATIARNVNIKKIRISSVGTDHLTIDYEPDLDYIIHLADDFVIENQILVFKILSFNDFDLNLKLLSANFHPDKNMIKELKKLAKKQYKSKERIISLRL
jgi:hypothetical protein